MERQLLCTIASILVLFSGKAFAQEQRIEPPLGIAVEYTNHAASAYIAKSKGFFKEAGLNLSIYESYATGTALAAALVRGDIQVAYICLVPAINVFANARVPIKIVAGTHKYGYGLAVNPQKIKSIEDLMRPGFRIGSVQVGSAVDVVLHKMIDKFGLSQAAIEKNIRRMNPAKQLLAAKMGRLDAVFVPEHWATLSETAGFKMLLTAKDIWPEMQGSVLVVKEDLLIHQPETVRKLVEVLKRATSWAHENPVESAKIMAGKLLQASDQILPAVMKETTKQFSISSDIMQRSMQRLEYTTGIDPVMVQDTIDYLALQSYIKKSFKSEIILDLRFLK